MARAASKKTRKAASKKKRKEASKKKRKTVTVRTRLGSAKTVRAISIATKFAAMLAPWLLAALSTQMRTNQINVLRARINATSGWKKMAATVMTTASLQVADSISMEIAFGQPKEKNPALALATALTDVRHATRRTTDPEKEKKCATSTATPGAS